MTKYDSFFAKYNDPADEERRKKIAQGMPEPEDNTSSSQSWLDAGISGFQKGASQALTTTIKGVASIGQSVMGVMDYLENNTGAYDELYQPDEGSSEVKFRWDKVDNFVGGALQAGAAQGKRVFQSKNLEQLAQNSYTGVDFLKNLPGGAGEVYRNMDTPLGKFTTGVAGLAIEILLDPTAKVAGLAYRGGAAAGGLAAKTGLVSERAADITGRLAANAATGNWVGGGVAMTAREGAFQARDKLAKFANNNYLSRKGKAAATFLEWSMGPSSLATNKQMAVVMAKYTALKEDLPKEMVRIGNKTADAIADLPLSARNQAQSQFAKLASAASVEAEEEALSNLAKLGVRRSEAASIATQYREANNRLIDIIQTASKEVPELQGMGLDLTEYHVRKSYRMFVDPKVKDDWLDHLVRLNTPGSWQIKNTVLRQKLLGALGGSADDLPVANRIDMQFDAAAPARIDMQFGAARNQGNVVGGMSTFNPKLAYSKNSSIERFTALKAQLDATNDEIIDAQRAGKQVDPGLIATRTDLESKVTKLETLASSPANAKYDKLRDAAIKKAEAYRAQIDTIDAKMAADNVTPETLTALGKRKNEIQAKMDETLDNIVTPPNNRYVQNPPKIDMAFEAPVIPKVDLSFETAPVIDMNFKSARAKLEQIDIDFTPPAKIDIKFDDVPNLHAKYEAKQVPAGPYKDVLKAAHMLRAKGIEMDAGQFKDFSQQFGKQLELAAKVENPQLKNEMLKNWLATYSPPGMNVKPGKPIRPFDMQLDEVPAGAAANNANGVRPGPKSTTTTYDEPTVDWVSKQNEELARLEEAASKAKDPIKKVQLRNLVEQKREKISKEVGLKYNVQENLTVKDLDDLDYAQAVATERGDKAALKIIDQIQGSWIKNSTGRTKEFTGPYSVTDTNPVPRPMDMTIPEPMRPIDMQFAGPQPARIDMEFGSPQQGMEPIDMNFPAAQGGQNPQIDMSFGPASNQTPDPFDFDLKTMKNELLESGDHKLIPTVKGLKSKERAQLIDDLTKYLAENDSVKGKQLVGYRDDGTGVTLADFQKHMAVTKNATLSDIAEFITDWGKAKNMSADDIADLNAAIENAIVYVPGSREFVSAVRTQKMAVRDLEPHMAELLRTELGMTKVDDAAMDVRTLDPVFAELFGEIDNFSVNAAEQGVKIGAIAARANMLSELRKRGLVLTADELNASPELKALGGWVNADDAFKGVDDSNEYLMQYTNRRAIEAIDRALGDQDNIKGLTTAANLFRRAALITDPSAHATQFMGNIAMLQMMGLKGMFGNNVNIVSGMTQAFKSVLMNDDLFKEAVDAGVTVTATLLSDQQSANLARQLLTIPRNAENGNPVSAMTNLFRITNEVFSLNAGARRVSRAEANIVGALGAKQGTDALDIANTVFSPAAMFQMSDQMTRLFAFNAALKNSTEKLIRANPTLRNFTTQGGSRINWDAAAQHVESGASRMTAEQLEAAKDAFAAMRDDAALLANDVALNYSDVPLVVQKLAKSGIVPFIKFQWKATGRIMKFMDETPWAFSPYVAAQRNMNDALNTDPDDLTRQTDSLSPTIRDSLVIPTGATDSMGRQEFIDTGRWLPFGMYTGAGRGIDGEMGLAGQPNSIVSTPVIDLYHSFVNADAEKQPGQSTPAFIAQKLAETFAPAGVAPGGRKVETLARAIEQSAYYVDAEGNAHTREASPAEKAIVGYSQIPEKIGQGVQEVVDTVRQEQTSTTATGTPKPQTADRPRTTVEQAYGRYAVPGVGFSSDPEKTVIEYDKRFDLRIDQLQRQYTKIQSNSGTNITLEQLEQLDRLKAQVEKLEQMKVTKARNLLLGE